VANGPNIFQMLLVISLRRSWPCLVDVTGMKSFFLVPHFPVLHVRSTVDSNYFTGGQYPTWSILSLGIGYVG